MTREEALNKIRQMSLPKETMEILEVLAPELAESEDERIRKALIDALKTSKSVGELKFILPEPTREECIAYLERQKEQKVSVDDFKAKDWYVSKVDGKIHNIYYSVDKVKPKFKVGDKIIEKDFDECGRGTIIDIKDGKYIFDDGGFICIEEQGLWKLVEQKPAEWSPTKEQMVALSWAANGMLDNDSPSAGDIKASLRTLYNDLQSKSIRPAEWSEEDEEMLERAIHIIVDYSDIDEEESEIVQNWLKSLRPSWKPSEEQMKALNEIVNILAASPFFHQNDYLFNILNGLREELKKLL